MLIIARFWILVAIATLAAAAAAALFQSSRVRKVAGSEARSHTVQGWRTGIVYGYALTTTDIGYRFDATDPKRVDELILRLEPDVERGMSQGSVIQVRTDSGRLSTYSCETAKPGGGTTCLTLVPRLTLGDLAGITVIGLFDGASGNPAL